MTETHFRIAFAGRIKGSLGVFSNYEESVWASTPDEAVLGLYEKYEHIQVQRILNMKTQERVFLEDAAKKPKI